MTRNLLACLLIVLLGLMSLAPSHAQSPDTWYFAWDNESGALFGYTLTGNSAPLLTIDTDFRSVAWRVDSSQALALLSVGGQVGLYRLSPEGAQPISADLGAQNLLPQVSQVAARFDPYWVLLASDGPYSIGLLLNTANLTIEPLTGESYLPIDGWKFSQDGQALRYLSRADRESSTWNLWQRELSSGNELGLYSFESPFPVIQAAQYGEQWLLSEVLESPRRQVYTAINADGTSRVVDEVALDGANALTVYGMIGSTELRFSAPCNADCRYEQLDLAGNPMGVYSVPSIPSSAVISLGGVDQNRLLVLADNTFWLLDNAQVGQALGLYDGVQLLLPPHQLRSPDGRWLVTADGAGGVRLWDLIAGQVVLERPSMNGVSVAYSSAGVLVRAEADPASTWLYRVADSQSSELPRATNGFFSEVLADGTILYTQAAEAEGRPAAIYRYNPSDGAYILVALNAFPLLMQ
jgi:WD40 repeat protein